jgi:hypothetical protein
MPDGPHPGQSYEAWIESKAGASPPEHKTSIVSSFVAGGYQAECVCGWYGPMRSRSVDALNDCRDHPHVPPLGARCN